MRPFDAGDFLYCMAIGAGLSSFLNHVVAPLNPWASIAVSALGGLLYGLLRFYPRPDQSHKPRTF